MWRDIEITSISSVAKMGYAVFAAFESTASHLFNIRFDWNRYETVFEDNDFEEVYNNDSKSKDTNTKSLADLALYVYAFGNDVRTLHLHTTGQDFISIHEKLNELYDVLFEAFDSFAEMAISHNETVQNPTNIKDSIEWEPLESKDFSSDEICKVINEKGNVVINDILKIKEYEPFVQSKVDEYSSELDKIINYIFKQISK